MNLTTDINILIVDDDVESLSVLKRYFRKELFTTYTASGSEEALMIIEKININVIITELAVADENLLVFIATLRSHYPDIVRIVLSGAEDKGLIIDAVNTGQLFRFIPKPVEPILVKNIVTDAIDYHRVLLENKALSVQVDKKNNYLTSINDELREVTARLRESETRFRSMNDAAFDPIFLLNDAGCIVYTNPAAESIFGYTRKEFLSMSFCDILLDYFQSVSATLSSCASSLDIQSMGSSLEAVKKNGEQINIEISTGSVLLKSKPHTVLIARDNTLRISEEKARLQLEKVQQTLESQIERRLLQSTLPTTLKGASLARFMVSSGHLNGDFMEVIVYDNQHADIMLGDVMGHGVLSALVGSGLKSLYLKTVAQKKHNHAEPPLLAEIVTEMHAQCINDLIELEFFATLFFLRIDLQTMEFSMIDCGHTATLHYQAAQGACSRLKGHNLPVGMIESQEFNPVKVPVAPDDLIVIYSDGITEARTLNGSLYGETRLFELVEKHHDASPDRIIREIRENLATATGTEAYDDDASCIVIRIDFRQDLLSRS